MLSLRNTLAVCGCSCGMPAFPSTGCATPFLMTSKGKATLAIEKGLEQSFLLELGKGQPRGETAPVPPFPRALAEVCRPAPQPRQSPTD